MRVFRCKRNVSSPEDDDKHGHCIIAIERVALNKIRIHVYIGLSRVERPKCYHDQNENQNRITKTKTKTAICMQIERHNKNEASVVCVWRLEITTRLKRIS